MKTTTVDQYLIQGCMRCKLGATPECKVHRWSEELHLLRSILLTTDLEEEVKWSQPCYTFQGKNVLIMAAFNDYAFISFLKGSLLKDEQAVLHSHGKNSQAAKYFKFTSVDEVASSEAVIKGFVKEAIELEKQGKKVEFKKDHSDETPIELEEAFSNDSELERAFKALTPGRQRGYLIYFNGAKQATTRISRIDKYKEHILKGKGFHDR